MLPSSHQTPREFETSSIRGGLLAEAFSEFISASARLELSYRDLQTEVAELSQALQERNQALNRSLAENKGMGLLLKSILDSMPCGVLVVNSEGAVRLLNPEAVKLLSLPPEQMATLSSILAHTGLDLRPHERNGLQNGSEQELSFERAKVRRWIAVRQVQLERFRDSPHQESLGEFLFVLRDISARKRMEQEREAARDAVALAQVSAVLAHEIRNPLASMELFAGLLEDDTERRAEWLFHLRAGIRSMSGTVNNVLALHGQAAPPSERIELGTEALLAVEFLRPLAQQADVQLCLEDKAGNLWIRANTSAFQQLLLNLVSNALRHTPPGGRVSIACFASAHDSERLRVAVTDTGKGISADCLPRVFECGFSGSGTTPGLGLAVCDRIMRQHGGSIAVKSRLGQGSTFTLEFPRA